MKKTFASMSLIAFIFASNFAFAQTLTEAQPAARALLKIDGIEKEMQSLTNRIEILESELAKQKEENQRLAKLIDEAAIKANAKAEPATSEALPAEALKSETSSDVAKLEEVKSEIANTEIAKPQTTEIKPNTPVVKPVATAAVKPTEPPPPKTSDILMKEAQILLQNGDYYHAELKLTELTEKYPNSKEYEDGLWFLGETRFVQKAFAPAAQAYVGYLTKAPNGARVPDSLVQLASSFRELGDNRQRCLALSEYKKRSNGVGPILKARADVEIAKGKCP